MNVIKKEKKLYIQAFREIRSYIIRNGLRPGDLLPTELEMSEKLGVSRNVLREAIKSMELMGMVQACPGRGTEVREFSLDSFFQNVLFFNVGGEATSELYEIFKANTELVTVINPDSTLTDGLVEATTSAPANEVVPE